MKKEDFDKILKNVNYFDVDEKGNVTPKPNVQASVTPEKARVVRLSYAIFTACHVHFSEDKNKSIEYARIMYEQMLPFFNDFEALVKQSALHGTGIHANDLSSLFEKHQEDCKHFYGIVEEIFLTPKRIKPFVEHALGREVNEVNFDFHEDKSKGVAYQNRIGQTDIHFR